MGIGMGSGGLRFPYLSPFLDILLKGVLIPEEAWIRNIISKMRTRKTRRFMDVWWLLRHRGGRVGVNLCLRFHHRTCLCCFKNSLRIWPRVDPLAVYR